MIDVRVYSSSMIDSAWLKEYHKALPSKTLVPSVAVYSASGVAHLGRMLQRTFFPTPEDACGYHCGSRALEFVYLLLMNHAESTGGL